MKEDNYHQIIKRKRRASMWMWISFAFFWFCGFINGIIICLLKSK